MIKLFQKHIFLPQDHGSWFFVFSPILAGLYISGRVALDQLGIILAAISFFLVRQPLTVLLKIYAGRREDKDLSPGIFWAILYGGLLLFSIGLILYFRQFFILIAVALPAMIMLLWQFILVYRHTERKQKLFEVLSTGLLSFIAAAILWTNRAPFDREGLLLWLLLFLQAAGSIFYAYSRLEQRVWKQAKPIMERIRASASTLLFTAVNLVFCAWLSQIGWVSATLWLAFSVQFLETLYSIYKPATGYKPTQIGFRQLAISLVFLVLLIVLW